MDFADLNETFFDNALVLASYRNRWRAIGVSIVSMRPASKKERELYEKSRR